MKYMKFKNRWYKFVYYVLLAEWAVRKDIEAVCHR